MAAIQPVLVLLCSYHEVSSVEILADKLLDVYQNFSEECQISAYFEPRDERRALISSTPEEAQESPLHKGKPTFNISSSLKQTKQIMRIQYKFCKIKRLQEVQEADDDFDGNIIDCCGIGADPDDVPHSQRHVMKTIRSRPLEDMFKIEELCS